jgi:hypothetical protein
MNSGATKGIRFATFFSMLQVAAYLLSHHDKFTESATRLFAVVTLYYVLGAIGGAVIERRAAWITSQGRAAFVGFVMAVPLGIGLTIVLPQTERTFGRQVAVVVVFAAVFGAPIAAGTYKSLRKTSKT